MTESRALNIVAIIPERVFFYCDYEHDSDVAASHTDGVIQVSIIRVKKSKGLSKVSGANSHDVYIKCSHARVLQTGFDQMTWMKLLINLFQS